MFTSIVVEVRIGFLGLFRINIYTICLNVWDLLFSEQQTIGHPLLTQHINCFKLQNYPSLVCLVCVRVLACIAGYNFIKGKKLSIFLNVIITPAYKQTFWTSLLTRISPSIGTILHTVGPTRNASPYVPSPSFLMLPGSLFKKHETSIVHYGMWGQGVSAHIQCLEHWTSQEKAKWDETFNLLPDVIRTKL